MNLVVTLQQSDVELYIFKILGVSIKKIRWDNITAQCFGNIHKLVWRTFTRTFIVQNNYLLNESLLIFLLSITFPFQFTVTNKFIFYHFRKIFFEVVTLFHYKIQ